MDEKKLFATLVRACCPDESARGVVACDSSRRESRQLGRVHPAGSVVWTGQREYCIVSHRRLSLRWRLRGVCRQLRQCVDEAGWAGSTLRGDDAQNRKPIFVVDVSGLFRQFELNNDWGGQGKVPAGRAAVAQWNERSRRYVVQVDELGCHENERAALLNLAEKLPGVSGLRRYLKELPPVLGVLTTLEVPRSVIHPLLRIKLVLTWQESMACVVWGGADDDAACHQTSEAYDRHFGLAPPSPPRALR